MVQVLGFLGKILFKAVVVFLVLTVLIVLILAVRYWAWKPTPVASFHRQGGEPGKTLNWGHRGAPLAAPENTLPAFKKAVDLGADGIELDVMLTADEQMVVIHDYTVDNTTDGEGFVKEYSFAELRKLDAGGRFGRKFAGEKIPTLQEVVDALDPGVFINIEIKSESVSTDGLEKQVVDFIAQNNLYDRVVVSSFNPISLLRVKLADDDIDVGLLYAPDLAVYLKKGWFIPILRPEALHPRHDMVDADYMAWARKKGFIVSVWTPDDPKELQRLLDLGVDNIITNRPDLLHKLLNR